MAALSCRNSRSVSQTYFGEGTAHIATVANAKSVSLFALLASELPHGFHCAWCQPGRSRATAHAIHARRPDPVDC